MVYNYKIPLYVVQTPTGTYGPWASYSDAWVYLRRVIDYRVGGEVKIPTDDNCKILYTELEFKEWCVSAIGTDIHPYTHKG